LDIFTYDKDRAKLFSKEKIMTNTWDLLKTVKTFLQQAWTKSGFEAPTSVQSQAIPLIIEGRDVIAESPTGTGKTLAYLLPILHKIDIEKKAVQAVILAPSRELVMQINDEITKWSEGSGINGASFIGGANVKRQLEKLKKHPQIVVGTPGRLQELIKMKKLKMHEVKTVVLDEGDQLLAPEHLPIIFEIIKSTLSDRQVILFSATLPSDIQHTAKQLMNAAEVLQVNQSVENTGNVEHIYIVCEQRDKIDVLRRIVKMEQMKALAFVRDINSLTVISEKLKFRDVSLGVLDAAASKQERERALKQLRAGEIPLLLATDVAARGLDIKGLTHVIHFDVPKDSGQYVHRSGRTGRMGASGTVLSIVTERDVRVLNKYARELGLELQQKELYKGQMVNVKKREVSEQQKRKSGANGKTYSKEQVKSETRPNSGSKSKGKPYSKDNVKTDSKLKAKPTGEYNRSKQK
jgi:superfamily II DNA/RNA helicase